MIWWQYALRKDTVENDLGGKLPKLHLNGGVVDKRIEYIRKDRRDSAQVVP